MEWMVAISLQDQCSVCVCACVLSMQIERLCQSAVSVCHEEAVEAEAGRLQPDPTMKINSA